MILSKTPLRMSYVGGGSDLSAFYKDELGAVLSTSIDKYIYVALNKKFDGKIRISYSKTEEVDSINEIEHPLVREAMLLTNTASGIEIASLADIPSKGSGLGSSSSFTVGLLNALYALNNKYVSKSKLAEMACEIEISRCGEPIGKQDQYAAAFGGLNLIKFHPDESVSVDPVICKPSVLTELQDSTLVFYTGRLRNASSVLAEQSESLANNKNKVIMRRMVELAFELKGQLEANSLDNFGIILDENWRLKTQLANSIADSQINNWYSIGLANGAHGGKLLGAGNGGFMMFFAPKDRHQDISNALGGLKPVKFNFEANGAQVVFYQPSGEESD
jgi:D-glycero-alpha-D-manno-heptose-7-phosphate kinase